MIKYVCLKNMFHECAADWICRKRLPVAKHEHSKEDSQDKFLGQEQTSRYMSCPDRTPLNTTDNGMQIFYEFIIRLMHIGHNFKQCSNLSLNKQLIFLNGCIKLVRTVCYSGHIWWLHTITSKIISSPQKYFSEGEIIDSWSHYWARENNKPTITMEN